MMAASALLAHTPSPTDEEINDAMNGNICRCGTYLRIRPAIHRAAAIAQNQLMKPAESARNLVGKI
jgi:isoquinoline 1-oxidoreductase alpha subunit